MNNELDRIFTSSMPSSDDIKSLSKLFDGVLILAESHEMEYDISLWNKYGVKYLHLPTRDFMAPEILEMYKGARWISKILSNGGRVLIHCVGGIGRSNTMVAAYLIYAHNYNTESAISKVRRVESPVQVSYLKLFKELLDSLPNISEVYNFASKYDFGRGIKHASKVTQFSMRIWDALAHELDFHKNTKAILLASSILHDIGCAIDDELHHKVGSELIVRSSLKDKGSIASLVYYHRLKAGDLFHTNLSNDEINLIGILRLADALDHSLTQSIIDIDATLKENTFDIVLKVLYEDLTFKISLRNAEKKKKILEYILRREIRLVKRSY